MKLDEFGRLAVRGIHDSLIQVLRFELNRQLDICLRDSDGNDTWIHVPGVVRVGFTDLVDGTIVSEIFVWQLGAAPPSAIPRSAWQALLGGNYVADDFAGTVSSMLCEHQGSYLVLVESSYGGTVAAISREALVVEPVVPGDTDMRTG